MPKPSLGRCRLMLALTALIALTSACIEQASEPGPSAGQTDAAQVPDDSETVQMKEHTDHGLSLPEAVDEARRDLATRLDAPVEQITVADARRVTWGNGSLGCPEAGMMYTQALVSGYYIRLQSDEADYHYHAGRDGQPFACPAERSLQPPSGRRGELE